MHIREELCEAALKPDSPAVHDGTRRRILIVAHRCVCVLQGVPIGLTKPFLGLLLMSLQLPEGQYYYK